MAGSSYGTTGAGGSSYGSTTGATVFTDLRLSILNVADALATPTDTPGQDTTRLEDDGTNRVLWTYDHSAGTWKGVQVT